MMAEEAPAEAAIESVAMAWWWRCGDGVVVAVQGEVEKAVNARQMVVVRPRRGGGTGSTYLTESMIACGGRKCPARVCPGGMSEATGVAVAG